MPKTGAMCRYSIRRSPPIVIRWGDRNGHVAMNCLSPLSCPQLLRIFLVSIASLPFSIFPLFSSTRSDGRVAEWLNVPDSKSGVALRLPWVRIPPLPLSLKKLRKLHNYLSGGVPISLPFCCLLEIKMDERNSTAQTRPALMPGEPHPLQEALRKRTELLRERPVPKDRHEVWLRRTLRVIQSVLGESSKEAIDFQKTEPITDNEKIKEWRCLGGHEFESLVSICPRCGKRAQRVKRRQHLQAQLRVLEAIIWGGLPARGDGFWTRLHPAVARVAKTRLKPVTMLTPLRQRSRI